MAGARKSSRVGTSPLNQWVWQCNTLNTVYYIGLEDIYLSEKVLQDIRSGKEKTYSAEEVFAEAGL